MVPDRGEDSYLSSPQKELKRDSISENAPIEYQTRAKYANCCDATSGEQIVKVCVCSVWDRLSRDNGRKPETDHLSVFNAFSHSIHAPTQITRIDENLITCIAD
eukprot:TRINITY_DN3903_c0_g1_i5.p2 TRINITY_DN3903_c0_g1~~TRINITY_DN3903_c0_g1_i5.p2  ORF type:complete len:104 (+),score=0.41 TRINITY_DN3903_c0_g1_i5:213-524(+)